MKYDCIVIGAGIGGLTCAATLAKRGVKVLLCEKSNHAGGTASVFLRNGYKFPAGPLSFSFPSYVEDTLSELGIKEKINFRRSHFQFKTDNLDVIISNPFEQLIEELGEHFPSDKVGMRSFFGIMRELSNAQAEILGENKEFEKIKQFSANKKNITSLERNKLFKKYRNTSALSLANQLVKNDILKILLSSQSLEESNMSALLAARMWNIISETGIWYPDIGFDGINNLLVKSIYDNKSAVRFNSPVTEIVMNGKHASGIKTKSGEYLSADIIVSTLDHKLTFLKMVKEQILPHSFVKWINSLKDSGSIFCVYLGVNPASVALNAFRADHLFYRNSFEDAEYWHDNISSEKFFTNREYEICHWTKKDKTLAPEGMETLVLRVNAPYRYFKKWEAPEGGRASGYYDYKKKISGYFIKAAESVLPGLSSAIEVSDASTPLTYQTWGGGSEGACAGWSWEISDEMGMELKTLIRTPISNLYMAGYQAFSQLVLGGYATAMHSGNIVAEMLLQK